MSNPTGTFTCKLDAKGRLMLPADFREQLGNQVEDDFILRPGLHGTYLELYTASDWNRLSLTRWMQDMQEGATNGIPTERRVPLFPFARSSSPSPLNGILRRSTSNYIPHLTSNIQSEMKMMRQRKMSFKRVMNDYQSGKTQ